MSEQTKEPTKEEEEEEEEELDTKTPDDSLDELDAKTPEDSGYDTDISSAGSPERNTTRLQIALEGGIPPLALPGPMYREDAAAQERQLLLEGARRHPAAHFAAGDLMERLNRLAGGDEDRGMFLPAGERLEDVMEGGVVEDLYGDQRHDDEPMNFLCRRGLRYESSSDESVGGGDALAEFNQNTPPQNSPESSPELRGLDEVGGRRVMDEVIGRDERRGRDMRRRRDGGYGLIWVNRPQQGPQSPGLRRESSQSTSASSVSSSDENEIDMSNARGFV